MSEKLDPVASGWPPCLHIIVSIVFLVKGSDRLTLEKTLRVTTSKISRGSINILLIDGLPMLSLLIDRLCS